MKGFLIAVLLGLVIWSNRDRVPVEYQFWKSDDTFITVQNNSDQEIKDIVVLAWSTPYSVGNLPKGKFTDLKLKRLRDNTEVVIRFRYGPETIERHAGSLTDTSGYRMVIAINF